MDETDELLGIELRPSRKRAPPPVPPPRRVHRNVSPRPPDRDNEQSPQQSSSSAAAAAASLVSLLAAVESGDVTATKKLLARGTQDVNEVHGPLRVTVLHIAAFHHPDLVPVLIQHGAQVTAIDKLGRTALHLACTAGNATCVASLLQAKADVNSQIQPPLNTGARNPTKAACKPTLPPWRLRSEGGTMIENTRKPGPDDASPTADARLYCSTGNELPVPECWGRTPLHQAVKSGEPGCVRLLLAHPDINVNTQDEKGQAPLLLAGAGTNPEDADAIKKYEDVVQQLLKMAKTAVNMVNPDTGASALHHAALLCSVPATKLLLERGANVACRSTTGDTPLHEAAHNGAHQVLAALLADPDGPDQVNKADHVGCTPLHKAAFSGARECLALLLAKGGDLSACTQSSTSVLDAVFMYIARPAHFLSSVLDSCVYSNNVSVLDRAFKVNLDFKILAPHGAEHQTSVMRDLLSSPPGPGHSMLLRHPLLETFLRLKWQRLRRFFFVHLFIYVCFLLSLSFFVVVAHHHRLSEPGQTVLKHARNVTKNILIYCSSFLLLSFAVQALLLPMFYIKSFETWIIALCGALSLVIACDFCKDKTSKICVDDNDLEWVKHITSFTVLLAWTELMLLIGRFPKWGNYALMFYTVLRNVLKVLLTFVCIVLGFALSFYVQFEDNDVFNNPWRAFVKTVVMMSGEFEYESMFKENSTLNWFSLDNSHRLPITSRLIFLLFIVIASIVMMNLMVGLAVSDIQGIQAEGHLRRLLKQAEFVDHLECIISHRIFNKLLPHCLMLMLSSRRSIDTVLVVQPSAVEGKMRRPHNLPYRLLESCVELAVRRRAMSDLKNNESSILQDLNTTGQRLSWYVDQVDSSKDNGNGNDPPSIDELLLRISNDLMTVKEILEPIRENSVSRQTSPNRKKSNVLNIPRNSQHSRRFTDLACEVQGAHVIMHKMGRASRSEWP